MADEEKQPEKQEEKAPKAEKPAAKPEKAEKPEAAKAEAPAAGGEKKGKKVSQMALSEVEAELKVVKEKMGGFQSAHARHLLARKADLTNQRT